MKKLVVLSGSGISAESGIKTFREMDGLWKQYDVTEVASPRAWETNRKLVLDFYNQRRKQLFECEPNTAYLCLAELEKYFDVRIARLYGILQYSCHQRESIIRHKKIEGDTVTKYLERVMLLFQGFGS